MKNKKIKKVVYKAKSIPLHLKLSIGVIEMFPEALCIRKTKK